MPDKVAIASSGSVHEADVVLRSGSTVRVRPLRPEDERRLAEFFRGLSGASRSLRFCGTVNDDFLDHAAEHFSRADPAGAVVSWPPRETGNR